MFTVNPSLVLLLNCFQKKEKKKSNIRMNRDRLPSYCFETPEIHGPEIKMDKLREQDNYAISFILYFILNGNHKY